MQGEKQYWFPAKTYGWGWGLPTAWQGWLVLVSFIVFVAVGIAFLKPALGNVSFAIYVLILTLLLIAICWLKGEPPTWRSGK